MAILDAEDLVVEVAAEDGAFGVTDKVKDGSTLGLEAGEFFEVMEVIIIDAFIGGDEVVGKSILDDVVHMETLEFFFSQDKIGRLLGTEGSI